MKKENYSFKQACAVVGGQSAMASVDAQRGDADKPELWGHENIARREDYGSHDHERRAMGEF